MKAAWAGSFVSPIICLETVAELTRILSDRKFGLAPIDQKSLFELYLPFAEIVPLPDTLPALRAPCRDPKDEVFIHLAQISGADFLVTGDRDLLDTAGTAPVRIIEIAALRAIIG